MGGECQGESCGTGSRASSCGSECDEECCSACGGDCGGDPMECAAQMWHASFFQAMKQLQVETLKAKMQKAWGAKMDKAADAVLEAMGVKWQSMLAECKAKEDLREKLSRLWQEGK